MRPSWGSLCQTTAVSVATILGTGILGLPVALHASGLRPFLLSFTITLFAQLGVVIAMTEILQRAHRHSSADSPVNNHYSTLAHQSDTPSLQNAPTLHSIGTYYIPYLPLRLFFNLIVLLHFLFILTAYALAGPQAYTALFPFLSHLPKPVGPTAFVLICASLALLAPPGLLSALTGGTIVKGSLLSLLVVFTLLRGLAIRNPLHDDWAPAVLVEPFLMGTLALSGIVNLMPVTFQACLQSVPKATSSDPLDATFVSAYRMATIIAVVICYVLNVAWSLAVLLCVPQSAADIPPAAEAGGLPVRASMMFALRTNSVLRMSSNATLSDANANGLISTVPLIQVLEARGGKWDDLVALLVNIFIALSITISFMVMSLGTKHYIDGEARSQTQASSAVSYDLNRRSKYIFYFSIVLLAAVFNPAAILGIMAGLTSMSLNMEAGLFVMYMLYKSRRAFSVIPAPLSSTHTTALIGFVGFYFASAVLIDAVFYVPQMFR